jgi:hypothetical protein
MRFIFILLIACFSATASFDDLELARKTAKENAEYNAQNFRQNSVMHSGWYIESRGDSTQDPKCPQGDGWATVVMVSPDHSLKENIKCSTVSSAVGCMPDADFKQKNYASDDNHCQDTSKVPYPLPKIAQ